MSKFDTHGGYFAPQGYMKINEGGSHEENPNGGVQVGVDQNGTPNLLEEGEPVYRDFVYSDNIKADGNLLKQFNIPEKYADKLYSEIADAFLAEAEERPNDPISANGLNAMLGRLADAQEEQKRQEQEAALMEELKNMSPEELASLEQALAQEAIPQEQMAPEVAPEASMQEEMPMMARGGNLYRKGDFIRHLSGLLGNALRRPGPPSGLEGFSPFGLSYGPMYLLKSPVGEDAETELPYNTVITGPTSGNGASGLAVGGGERYPEVVEETSSSPASNAGLMARYGYRSGLPISPVNVPNLLSDDNLDAIIRDADLPFETVPINTIEDTDIDVPELSEGLLRKAKWDKIKGKLGGFDMRLLSPLVDAAMGIANLATPADHYDYTPIRPYLPSGRIRQQYERYNPIDQNMITNQMLAQANANMRALRNAGLGPSTGANLLAADYNAGLNLGNALANVWDANNQRRNQVIAQNNLADKTIADFDWNVEMARANALNQFAPYNQRMALQTQMLNNQAEQDKYNAVAASINSGKKFLNDYGWELMNRNMVNSNRGLLGYGIDRMNNVVYDKNGNPILLAKCGGKINKKK